MAEHHPDQTHFRSRACSPPASRCRLPQLAALFEEQDAPAHEDIARALEELQRRNGRTRRRARRSRLRLPLPGPRGRARLRLAPVDRAADALLARTARNAFADRLSPADHARGDRTDPRRRRRQQHRAHARRTRMGARGRLSRPARQARAVRHDQGVPRLFQPEVARPAAAAQRNPRHRRHGPATFALSGRPNHSGLARERRRNKQAPARRPQHDETRDDAYSPDDEHDAHAKTAVRDDTPEPTA